MAFKLFLDFFQFRDLQTSCHLAFKKHTILIEMLITHISVMTYTCELEVVVMFTWNVVVPQ